MKHGDLDDVARGPLNRHVDGFTLCGFANVRVAIIDALEWTNSSVKRSHVSVLTSLHRNLVHVATHAFVGFIVIIDHFARFLAADADAL